MARNPIRFKAMIRDAYGARWIGPFSTRAAVNQRVREEMSPDREGPRGAVVYRYDSDVPLAHYSGTVPPRIDPQAWARANGVRLV